MDFDRTSAMNRQRRVAARAAQNHFAVRASRAQSNHPRAGRWGGCGRGKHRRCRRAVPAPHVHPCKSVRRSNCRWWRRRENPVRPSADDAAGSTAASRRGWDCREPRNLRFAICDLRFSSAKQSALRASAAAVLPAAKLRKPLSRFPAMETSARTVFLRDVFVRARVGRPFRCAHPPSDEIRQCPLTATIFPARIAWAAASSASLQRPAERGIFRRSDNAALMPAASSPQFQARAANRARIRLRVKAAVARVVVFGLALRAHREFLHRSVRAVVRQGFDDAEARAAIRAIRERIAVAAVFRIENFAQAIGTGGDVRQHQRGFAAAGFTCADFKLLETDGVEPRGFEALNETARGFSVSSRSRNFSSVGARAFGFDENALRRIVDPAGEFQFRRQPEDERTETHALHRAANGEFQAGFPHSWIDGGCSSFRH